MKTTADTTVIYRSDWVLPVATPVIKDGAVAVGGSRILDVGAAADVIRAYPGATVHDVGRAILMPGFVNCHSHVEYTSFRGIIDDLDFGDWTLSLIDARETLSAEEYLVSARLGTVEALSSGITTLSDTMVMGASLQALSEAGLRGRVNLEIFGIDDTRVDETMTEIRTRLVAAQAASPAQLVIGLAPHSPYTVSSGHYKAISDLARELDLHVVSHVAESRDELTYVRSGSGILAHDFREKMGWERLLVQPYGVTPIKYLQQWDAFKSHFLAVHCVQVTRDDIRILRKVNAAVVHCPKSNAKLGCGVAPLSDFRREGLRVGLGTDSPPATNIMDMFGEMRTMLFLQRAVERDVHVLNAEDCIRLATLGGAEALDMAGDIGSLEPGKFADMIVVDVSRSHFTPIDDPYSALVYGANQDDVRMTIIGGRARYHDGRHIDIDAHNIRSAAHGIRARLSETMAHRGVA